MQAPASGNQSPATVALNDSNQFLLYPGIEAKSYPWYAHMHRYADPYVRVSKGMAEKQGSQGIFCHEEGQWDVCEHI